MEEDLTPNSFKLGGDDRENDAVMQAELQELKIEKLSQRVLLLTILIPCMIGIIVVVSYLDIKGRVSRTQSTGTIGVQKLSKEMESRFSSLSLEQAKLEEVQAKKIPLLEKDTAFLQTRLKKMQDAISALDAIEAAKVEHDELEKVVASFNAKIDAIPKLLEDEMASFRSTNQELKTKAAALEKQLGEMTGAVSQLSDKLTGLQKDLSSLSTSKIDKSELELALKLKEIGFRQEILEATTAVEKKFEDLRKEVSRLKESQAKPAAATPQPVQPETQKAASQPAPKPAETDSIEEQNLE